MTWFLVILFMEWEEYPVYMFTNPTFNNKQECVESATNPEDIQGYVAKLLTVYGRPMPIKGVLCIDENQANQLLSHGKS